MRTPAISGFLMHISHYDPKWCKDKDQETPFELKVAMDVLNAMHKAGMNLLLIDCADGVEYKSHPELKRHYTVPMSHLEELSEYARNRGIEIVPKLNFSQSRYHRHNEWFYPYNEFVDGIELFESEEYWRLAFELIDELIEVCQPQRFFHIGMDEDNDRAHSQFADAINTLSDGLRKRKLRTIIWKDTRTDPRGFIFTEKQFACEDKIPKDTVQMVWDYTKVIDPNIIRSLENKGIEVWGAPG
ncbi:MAG: hypothetical protein PHV82_19045, partial [Victivallaceae bacterium]|nr:hypothetical protein [Victivallaceae bacterium]